MKSSLIVLALLFSFMTGCADYKIHSFDPSSGVKTYSDGQKNYTKTVEYIDDEHTYKLLEMYSVNSIIPTLTYPIMFQCDKFGEGCVPLNLTPIQQPGVVTGLAAPVLQGMAIVGGAYLIRDGLKHSGTSVNQSQTGGGATSNATGGNSSSSSSATGGNASASSSASQSQSQSSITGTVNGGIHNH